MKSVRKEDALAVLQQRQEAGYHVDSRLFKVVKADETVLFLMTLFDATAFFSLIWLEGDYARLLTPPGEPRTVRDVASRMIHSGYTFQKLASNLGFPRHQHCPEWFRQCVDIDIAFSYEKFGWIAITTANDHEQFQSPMGSFYIYDGIHKTLVLAKRLLTGEEIFSPVDCLFFFPRSR